MLRSRSAHGARGAVLRGGRLGVPALAVVGASALVVVGVAACDPTRTDPSYWDRAPGLAAGSATGGGEAPGGADGDGGVAAGGGADPEPIRGACARVEVTTISYRGEYAPANVGAIWITTAAGGFVRTLDVWGSKRLKHAVAWLASSNGNDVDAVTGATRKSAGGHVAPWDCRDAAGVEVAPGAYVVHVEFTEENSSTGSPRGPHQALAFDVAAAVSAATAPDQAGFSGLRVVPLP
ncbi:MAG: DUF2271 domain-containing protein [Labilithrix sp.]|nr:DUF2271 domain-containing protein [Labilithrix sp.]